MLDALSPFLQALPGSSAVVESAADIEAVKIQLLDLGIWLQLALIVVALGVGVIVRPMLARLNFIRNEKVQNLVHAADFPLPVLVFLWLSQVVFILLGESTPLLVSAATAMMILFLWALIGRLELRKQPRTLLRGMLLIVMALLLTDQTEATVEVLEAARVQLGDFELNLWHVVKAATLFGLIVWTVSQFNRILVAALTGTRVTASGKTLFVKLTNVLGIVIGGFVALQMLGIDLKALAFFGGALGLGLGFGLKSIVSNYVAGIILLLDKSLKPGDVIEVDAGTGESTYGVIEEMKARNVVVRPRNHADILIPNETLLINQVTNWSYKSRAIRQDMIIGVSYDSDIEKIPDILIESIEDHPRVLKVPKPVCFIEEFADSSVNFELRFWMRDPENGVQILKGALYMLVWKALKDHNVEIPFPQRVLHMADSQPAIKKTKKGKK